MRPHRTLFFCLISLAWLSTLPSLALALPPQPAASRPTGQNAPPRTTATTKPTSVATTQSASPQRIIARFRRSGPHHKPSPLFDPNRTSGLVQGQALYWIQAFSVLFVLGAIVIFIFIVLRWASARAGLPLQSGQHLLQVHARMALEPKKAIWLVSAAQQHFLIASHEHGVTFLATLDPKQTQAALAEKPPQSGGFWSLLRKNTESNKESDSSQAADPIPTHFEVVSDGRKQSQDQTKP